MTKHEGAVLISNQSVRMQRAIGQNVNRKSVVGGYLKIAEARIERRLQTPDRVHTDIHTKRSVVSA